MDIHYSLDITYLYTLIFKPKWVRHTYIMNCLRFERIQGFKPFSFIKSPKYGVNATQKRKNKYTISANQFY